MARHAPLTVLAVAALTLVGAACGSDDEPPESATSTTAAQVTTSTAAETTTTTAPASVTMAGETVSTTRLRAIAAGLCEAAQQAATDISAAAKTFNSKSHDGLHVIARGLQEIDRPAAATLLEAKQKVEGDISNKVAGTQLAADLRSLSDVTKSSLARFNVTVDACPAT
ncbi:MAG TPA: hypothetical protein VJS45_05920 [Acidimicrobiia bacterium]|nr:hypothetical protein [Acidimicrobiia bacterium]